MTEKSYNTLATNVTATALVRLSLLAPFVENLKARNVSVDAPLTRLGLTKDQFSNSEMFVHAEVMYGLLNEFAAQANDPYLGVHVGEEMEFSKWPPFIQAVEKSHTLSEFLTYFIQAVPHHATTVVHSIAIFADIAEYRMERTASSRNRPAQSDGFGLAVHLRLFQSVLPAQSWKPDQIKIYTAYPEAIPPMYGGVRVAHRPGNIFAIEFPTALLSEKLDLKWSVPPQELPKAEPSLVSAIQAVAIPLLATSENLLDDVSVTLGIASDALEKALTRQKTSFAREIRELKNESICKALVETDISIADLGAKMGYLDAGNFTRYFKSQFNITPLQYRRSKRAES